jgi:hypothetical protein
MRYSSVRVFEYILLIAALILFFLIAQQNGLYSGTGAATNKTKQNILATAALYVDGHRIKSADTDQVIILRGALSDFFRRGETDLDGFINRTQVLKNNGLNLIGLYFQPQEDAPYSYSVLSDDQVIDLDKYVEYTYRNGVYVYFMPVAREFSESSSAHPRDRALSSFIEFLVKRYRRYPHILYGFGAEVESRDITWDIWETRQTQWAKTVRQYDSDAIIIATGAPYYNVAGARDNPLPIPNVMYLVGGYPMKDSISAGTLSEDEFNRRIQGVTKDQGITDQYPLLYGEFGGFWGGHFSSKKDLLIIEKILDHILKNEHHYTAYRIAETESGLELFDTNNNLTEKGELFAEAYQYNAEREQTVIDLRE